MRQNPTRVVMAPQEYPTSTVWSAAGIPAAGRQPQRERRTESHPAMTSREATFRFPFKTEVIDADAHEDGQLLAAKSKSALIPPAGVSEVPENVESASQVVLPWGMQW